MSRIDRMLALHDAAVEVGSLAPLFRPRRYLQERYKHQPELLRAAYRMQEGKCAICAIEPHPLAAGRAGASRLVTDHCHTCGVFRGWLCDLCNRAAVSWFESPLATLVRLVTMRRASTSGWRVTETLVQNPETLDNVVCYLRRQDPCWIQK